MSLQAYAGYNAASGDDPNTFLGVLVGCHMVMVSVRLPEGYTMGQAAGKAMGRTTGCGMAGALAVVPAEKEWMEWHS